MGMPPKNATETRWGSQVEKTHQWDPIYMFDVEIPIQYPIKYMDKYG